MLDFDTTPVALMATVNATAGGLGPNEDLEGNIGLGAKGKMMKELGLNSAPGIVVESKAYIPSKGDQLQESTFLYVPMLNLITKPLPAAWQRPHLI